MIYIIILILILIIILAFDKKAVPIFLYHQVNPLSNVFPELFEEHLKIIKKHKMKTITITDFYMNKVEKNSILLVSGFQHYNLQGANHHVEWIFLVEWKSRSF